MIDKLIIATKNKHKFEEMSVFFQDVVKNVLALPNDYKDIVEDGSTFLDNSLIKAKTSYESFLIPSLADDSGICIDSLGGRPGFLSARYGGEKTGYYEKIKLILNELKDIKEKDRGAYFITSAVLVISKDYYIAVEGRVYGKIILKPKGLTGFGYDPIFLPDGYTKTYSEMSFEEKNKMSHRAIAMKKIKNILSLIHQIK